MGFRVRRSKAEYEPNVRHRRQGIRSQRRHHTAHDGRGKPCAEQMRPGQMAHDTVETHPSLQWAGHRSDHVHGNAHVILKIPAGTRLMDSYADTMLTQIISITHSRYLRRCSVFVAPPETNAPPTQALPQLALLVPEIFDHAQLASAEVSQPAVQTVQVMA